MGACGNLFKIGSANSGGMDTNQHLSRTNLRDRNSFHAHVIDAAVYRSQHRGRDRMRRVFNGRLSGKSHTNDFR